MAGIYVPELRSAAVNLSLYPGASFVCISRLPEAHHHGP